ncbi:hypothetical protein AGMMS4952_24280 [Spirochaetia bacterium]|nr:hypothetical protein AGMMS4952_24280 [Spirochaetia bacterium]
MKKKECTMVVQAFMLVLVFSIFGCDFQVPVEGTVELKTKTGKAAGVSNVEAKLASWTYTSSYGYTSIHNYIIVTWDAVDNAGGYDIYVRQEGKKTITAVNESGYYGSTMAGGVTYEVPKDLNDNSLVTTQIDDSDKWSGYFSVSNISSTTKAGIKYQVGIQTFPFGMVNTTYSDIVWSATSVTLP